jgi:TRAP-type mannitol/chloroaromatic compound transport system substrate-binding protein
MLHNFINIDKWNSLSPNYKAVVRTASAAAHTWMQAKYDAVNPAALKRLVASGTKLIPFSTPVLEACLNAALDLYHEVSATNPDFKKVYESMTAFRGDQYLWWQVAEYSNDTFMIRNRTKV